MFTGIVRDITDRKQAEMAKREFVSIVSHELRTPLTSIKGSLGLVRGDALGAIPAKVKSKSHATSGMADCAYRSPTGAPEYPMILRTGYSKNSAKPINPTPAPKADQDWASVFAKPLSNIMAV